VGSARYVTTETRMIVLQIDGIFGPVTWRALVSGMLSF